MAEQRLRSYQSRRNRAELFQTLDGQFVRKTFCDEASFEKELQIYRLLQDTPLPCAKVLRTEENALVLTRLPGQTLVECLEQQEQTGVMDREVWRKLAAWLADFHRHTGFVMTDVNLRNFLYDSQTKTLHGLDFEECDTGSKQLCAARVLAFLLSYRPQNTRMKQDISMYLMQLFTQQWGLDSDLLFGEVLRQKAVLRNRRNK